MCTDDIALEHLERDTGIAISIDVYYKKKIMNIILILIV